MMTALYASTAERETPTVEVEHGRDQVRVSWPAAGAHLVLSLGEARELQLLLETSLTAVPAGAPVAGADLEVQDSERLRDDDDQAVPFVVALLR